jgi:hypothetical protein
MVTLIGIPLGLIMLALYLVSLYVSKVIVGFGIGLWILNRLNAEKKFTGNLLWPLVVGLILYVIITQLPLVGWIFGLLGMIWALGAAFVVKRETLRGLR